MSIFLLERANWDSRYILCFVWMKGEILNHSSNWNPHYSHIYCGGLDPCHSYFYMLKSLTVSSWWYKVHSLSSQDWFFLWVDMLHRSTLSSYVVKVIRHAVTNDHGRLLEMLQNNSEPSSICNFQGWLAITTQNEPSLGAELNFSFPRSPPFTTL